MNARSDMRKPLFSIMIAAVLALMGAYFPPVLMVLPGVLVLIGLMWNYTSFIAAVVAATAVCAVIPSITFVDVIGLIVLFLPTTIILYFGLYFKRSYRGILLVSCIASTAGVYLLLTLSSILAGKAPFEELISSFQSFSTSLTTSFTGMGVDAQTIADIADQLDTMQLLLPTMLPAFVVGCGMFAAFFSFLIAAIPAYKRKADSMRPMAPFHLWKLGKSFTLGIAILFLGGLIVNFSGMAGGQAVFMVVQVILILPLALQGLCFDTFVARLRNRSTGKKALIYIILIILIPYSVIFLMLYGLMDQLFRLRDRLTPPPPPQNQDV